MHSLLRTPVVALALACLCASAYGEEAAPAAAPQLPSAPAVTPARSIPAGAAVYIEIAQMVSSRTAARGDRFKIRLVEPIVVDGMVLAPRGSEGIGEVVHAAKARGGGKQGELILAARYIEIDGVQVPLRGFRIGVSGKSNGGEAAAVGIALSFAAAPISPLSMIITGGEIEVPEGAPGMATVSATVTLTPSQPSPESSIP